VTIQRDDGTFYLGRQAIYDRSLEIFAYEILYRDGLENRAQLDPEGGDQASARVIADLFLELGIDAVTESRPAFVNLTRRLLFSDIEELFPAAHFYLEVLEDIHPDAELARRLAELRQAGYRVVLDDFRYSDAHELLLEQADIVKVDIMDHPDEASLDRDLARIRRPGLKLLAEKIEEPHQARICFDRDFDYFQGYILAEPDVLQGRRLAVPRRGLLELLARINDPDTSWREVVSLVQSELAIAYRVMRFIGAAETSLAEVGDLEEALAHLGRRRLRAWINLALLAEVAPTGDAQRRRALVRALMAEELGRQSGEAPPSLLYVAGLFSGLESQLGLTREEMLTGLPLRPELSAALLRGEGPIGRLLGAVLAYECGDLAALERGGFALKPLRDAWLLALERTRI
jgi:c-di-GMP phosphodiesterase